MTAILKSGDDTISGEWSGPASVVQSGVWIEAVRHGNNVAYHEPLVIRLRGPLEVRRLEWSLNRVIDRQPALRTVFRLGKDDLLQRVTSFAPIAFDPIAEPREDTAELAQMIDGTISEPFDFHSGPLFRARLVRTGSDVHVLILVVHHLIADGWSLGLFCRELSEFYRSYPAGSSSHLRRLRGTPIGYAQRQCRLIAEGEVDGHLSYWSEHLQGRTARPLFPPLTSEIGAVVQECNLSAQLTGALDVAARSLRTSPFCILFATFAAAIRQLSGQSDLLIAIDFADRGSPGDEDLIGLFVNQMPLRIQLAAPMSGQELMRLAHTVCLGALRHKDAPYPLIRQMHKNDGDDGSTADVEAKIVLHNFPPAPLELADVEATALETRPLRAKFPVLLEFWPQDEGLRGIIVCDSGRVSNAVAARLADGFRRLLHALIDDPTSTIVQNGINPAHRPFKPKRTPIVIRTDPVTVAAGAATPGSPTVFLSRVPGLDLEAWVRSNLASVREHLLSAGAILFRGFTVGTPARFGDIVRLLGGDTLDYVERTTPRSQIAPGIFTSTEYPADQEIFFHNENAYASSWPSHIHFWCEVPPAQDGFTPLADCRRVLQHLPADIRREFDARGILYRRTFRGGLGIDWRRAFAVQGYDELLRRYAPLGYRFELSPDALVADFRAPATIVHPMSGETVWFNHAGLFHAAALQPEVRAHLKRLGDERLQVETRFGDDSPIPDDWIHIIRKAYRDNASRFAWRFDDLLYIDNRLIAHSRTPFKPPRRIVAAMTGPTRHGACP